MSQSTRQSKYLIASEKLNMPLYLCPLVVVTGHGMNVGHQSLKGKKKKKMFMFVCCPISNCFTHVLLAHLHGWPQQDVSALVSGHLGITRLPVVSYFYYYTATVEDVYLGHKAQIRHANITMAENCSLFTSWNVLILTNSHLLKYASKPVISPTDPPE